MQKYVKKRRNKNLIKKRHEMNADWCNSKI